MLQKKNEMQARFLKLICQAKDRQYSGGLLST